MRTGINSADDHCGMSAALHADAALIAVRPPWLQDVLSYFIWMPAVRAEAAPSYACCYSRTGLQLAQHPAVQLVKDRPQRRTGGQLSCCHNEL